MSKSYEVDYQAVAEAFSEAVRKVLASNSGQAAEDADSDEWSELKRVYSDYQEASSKLIDVQRQPWNMSLNDPDLRFQKKD